MLFLIRKSSHGKKDDKQEGIKKLTGVGATRSVKKRRNV
jgi:hypothetical protein